MLHSGDTTFHRLRSRPPRDFMTLNDPVALALGKVALLNLQLGFREIHLLAQFIDLKE